MAVDLTLGASYVRRPIPTYPIARKGILVRVGDGVVDLRDPASGLVHTEATKDLEGPVEPDPPPEVCPVCDGTRKVPHYEATDKPWVRLIVGTEPCPACCEEVGD